MITTKATYEFKNGVTVEFTIRLDKTNPIGKVEWSCPITKENIEPLNDEYMNSCVPKIYQEIANFLGETIMWVDKHMKEKPKVFYPEKNNN